MAYQPFVRIVSIPSQAGILLAGASHASCGPRLDGLNTLSGGHPLGGLATTEKIFNGSASQYPLRRASSWRIEGINTLKYFCWSQYPLRRASSWRGVGQTTHGLDHYVSIPSQAGILLAGKLISQEDRLDFVSIPSQAGILLAAFTQKSWADVCVIVSIPSQAGILLAVASAVLQTHRREKSQYPLRRASSWRTTTPRTNAIGMIVSIPSQAGILLAAFKLQRQACRP